MSVHTDKHSIVLEVGSRYIKCGVSEERAPRCVLRWDVAELIQTKPDLLAVREYLSQQLHKICFDMLHINPRHRRFLVCEDVLGSRLLRNALADVLFVDLKASAVTLVPSAIAAMYSSSHHTALIIDCGYNDTRILPVYKGIPLPYLYGALGVGTRSCCTRLLEQLSSPSVSQEFLTAAAVESALERGCFVQGKENRVMDVADAAFRYQGQSYVIPSAIRSAVCEHLFVGDENMGGGIVSCVQEVVRKLPLDVRGPLVENILVIGGTAMIPGFVARLQDDISAVVGEHTRVIDTLFPRNLLAWIGGSIFAATDLGKEKWTSSTEYTAAGSRCLPDWTSIAENETEI